MNEGYIKSLDGVRAIAIILVMSFHAGLTHFGWIGVQLFFVLSGFLITGILWKEKLSGETISYKLKKFWVRRSLRIFPLYFGYLLLLGILFLLIALPESYSTYFPYLITYTFNYTRSAVGWQGSPFFTHLWSLCIEEQFYLLFPLVIFFCSRRFIKFFMLLVIIAAPFVRLFLGEFYKSKGLSPEIVADSVYWNTLSHLDAFFIGGLIPVLSLNTKIKKPNFILIASAIALLCAGLFNFMNSNSGKFYLNDLGYNHGSIKNYEHVWHYSLLNIFFASFILSLVSIHSNYILHLRKSLEKKWMIRIGRVSYGMYIYHWGILAYFYSRFFKSENIIINIVLFIPYVLLVYLVAELSYRVYENRFILLKDQFFAHKKTQAKDDMSTIEVTTFSKKNA